MKRVNDEDKDDTTRDYYNWRSLQMTAKYGWIIDVDHLCTLEGEARDLGSDVGVMGPSDISRANACALADMGFYTSKWRCKDADGEVYYEGRYIGPDDMHMFGPLEDFARPNAGAIDIEYLNEKTQIWEAL